MALGRFSFIQFSFLCVLLNMKDMSHKCGAENWSQTIGKNKKMIKGETLNGTQAFGNCA